MNDNEIERALAVSESRVDTEAALERLRSRATSEHITPVMVPTRRRAPARWLQGVAAAAAVVIIASGLALSGAAGSIFNIFEPKQIVGVPVTKDDLSYLGGACANLQLQQCLGTYGTFAWTTPPQP